MDLYLLRSGDHHRADPISRWARDEHRRGDPFAAEPDPALLAVTVPEVLSAVRRLLSGACLEQNVAPPVTGGATRG
ncbi:MAG: hypothetical protein ACRDRV_17175 [Pseudonocardiaceae bacterium]